ncbi:MAG: hypothetical protein AAFZ89_12630 [Bacteroidota bacterium]
MKIKLLIPAILLFAFASVQGQIKIGDNPQNIDPASVLELESDSRVLVITRVNTAQMNAIVPSQGALVYNTDVACIHYYDGNEWINICDTVSDDLDFTNRAIINTDTTIAITRTGNNYNFEVSEIRGENIVDFSITGIDILGDSITADKLAPDSVGKDEIQDRSVGREEIDQDTIPLSFFINDIGFASISTEPNNSISDNNGVFYEDPDDDATNEIQTLSINGNDLSFTGAPGDPITIVPLPTVDGANLDISDQFDPLSISGDGTPGNLYEIADNAVTTLKILDGTITSIDLATDAVITPNITDDNVTVEKIAAGTNGQILTTDAMGDVVWAAPSASGTTELADQMTITGDGTTGNEFQIANGGVNTLQLANNAVATDKILDENVTPAKIEAGTDGQFLTTNGMGDVVWTSITPGGEPTGTEGSIFFADTDQTLTFDNTQLFWDNTSKVMGIGLNTPNDQTKLHIAEIAGNNLNYALQLQNIDAVDTGGSATGILFSIEELGNFGKGALVYERIGSWARGDFHILQNQQIGVPSSPSLADAVVTVQNDGDMGIGTTTPTSRLEVQGSIAYAINPNSSGSITLGNDDHTIIVGGNLAITLPLANTCAGRFYIIKNPSFTVTIDSYIDTVGSNVTAIPAGGVVWLQSDGTNWQQVN